ncbi:hypothetical protein BAE44_0015643 [Dichanthelium oligosanthes]|uniref:Uncharacterized protein n=1 Tax=Dichanthelium oligosanthes TaxID=888268 RepID=A0A1E5VDW7_9POAL|nr:hypothetical protein BAE44_0015643 [Dichanthelium oligosanthes]
MVATRRARQLSSGDARPVRHVPAAAGPKPKKTPKRAKKPSPPPPPEDVGAQGSGEASPVRDAPPDEIAAAAPAPRKRIKTKTTAKRAKRPPPPSQEERGQDEVEESGDPSLVSKAPPDETAAVSPRREIVASPDHNKRGATSAAQKRAKRGATLPQEEEEHGEKRAAEANHDGTGRPPANKVNHKRKKKKVQAPESAELGLAGNIEEAPDARNTSSPQEKDSAQEEQQLGEEMVEQDHAGNTSPPQVNDGAHKDEQQGEEVSEQEHAGNTSVPQQKDGTHENEDTGVEKKPAVERLWSQADELKILTALVEHASDLLAKITFEKSDANEHKIDDKIRKLRAWYHRLHSQGCPTDDLGRRLFELCDILWGQVDDDVRVEAAFFTRDFSQRSSLYPYLAEEVKVYAKTHSSGNLIMAAFTTIGDDTARRLDAMCKKQRVDALNLDLSQANLNMAVLSAFSSQIN